MKKIYFASDFHFGIPDREASRRREDLFVRWLDEVKQDAEAIYLMGDLFDFWFEYGSVVPRGFIRLLGKLAEITDAGIPVHLFKGNHDLWAFGYLAEETGLTLHRVPEIHTCAGKKLFLAHGDGLGPGDHGYKLLRRVFECPLCQWLFRWLHPDLGTRMALYFSRKSRLANIAREGKQESVREVSDEMLLKFAQKAAVQHPGVDYFVFGHRHLPLIHPLANGAQMILLGDWLVNFTYGVFDGDKFELKSYS